ncbi:MAG: tetratricopeptide repeat protein [Rhodospirillales bacterium]
MARLHGPYLGIVLLLAASIGLGAGGARADFDAGMDAYKKGHYERAFEEWLPAARGGDPHAQHMLGFLYAQGRGVDKDFNETVLWWQQAARQGLPAAQFTLGTLYLEGTGVRKNIEVAAKLVGAAAEAGFADAQYLYGLMHVKGEGVKRDIETAMMWLNRAAQKKGVPPTVYWTAIMPYLTPDERRDARALLDDWRPEKRERPN